MAQKKSKAQQERAEALRAARREAYAEKVSVATHRVLVQIEERQMGEQKRIDDMDRIAEDNAEARRAAILEQEKDLTYEQRQDRAQARHLNNIHRAQGIGTLFGMLGGGSLAVSAMAHLMAQSAQSDLDLRTAPPEVKRAQPKRTKDW